MTQFSLDRRSLFKGTGALVVSLSIPGSSAAAEIGGAVKPPLAPDQLDSWLAIKSDGAVVAYFGKMDMGQGVDVAIAQIVAEELDVPFARVGVVMGDTLWTVNQGGASGSTGVQKGGIALRNAAAEARRVLLELASARLGVPTDRLEVADGVVAVSGDPARKLSYGELIGGRYFDLPMKWNGKLGNDLVAEGQAKPKPPGIYKIVGTSPPRFDVPAKVFGQLDYVTDVKVPGMLHGRMIRPPVAGAMPVAVDESSVRDIPGVRVVHDKGFLGILAEREWDAVQAAERLVTWSEAAPPFPENSALYHHIRQAPVVKREVPVATGEIDPVFSRAARVVEAEYEWPFQSHASMGPACAVVDAREDGATLWTGSQKPHFARDGVARALGLPQDKVHGIWVPGPGSYGRNDAGDAGIDAALLSKAVGRPVRVQACAGRGMAGNIPGRA
jgi:CO/xanthine dehydrogenase Mo-binding subunit